MNINTERARNDKSSNNDSAEQQQKQKEKEKLIRDKVLADSAFHRLRHLDADLRRRLLVVVLRVDELGLVIRQSLLHSFAVQLFDGDSLDRHDVGDGVGVDEREPAADEVLLDAREGRERRGERRFVGSFVGSTGK